MSDTSDQPSPRHPNEADDSLDQAVTELVAAEMRMVSLSIVGARRRGQITQTLETEI